MGKRLQSPTAVSGGAAAGPFRAHGSRALGGGASLAAACASLGLFLWLFDPERDQRLVDALWPLTALFWAVFLKLAGREPFLGVRPRKHDLWPIGLLLAAFAAGWLPFYDNWRWAYTGDSFGVVTAAYWLGRKGLRQNLLSVHGIEDSFTYLWEVTYGIPVLLFEPTFFWHRFGMLLVALFALLAIYTFFALSMGRLWAAIIVVATATNSVWLWFSYVSYFKVDSFVFYYLTLSFGILVWRFPERLGPWMLCGLVGGLSLMYTQTSWSGVAYVGLLLGAYALWTRRIAAGAVYAVSFLLAATPMLLEIPWLLRMIGRFSGPAFDFDYWKHIYQVILLLPYEFNYYKLGVQGAFLKWPLGHAYLAGIAVAAATLVPWVRRRLRLPRSVPVLLGLLLWDVLLLTVTNRDYGQPSTKRAYNLIPLQIYFALLPAYAASRWLRSQHLFQAGIALMTCAAVAVSAYGNFSVMRNPRPHVYGGNIYDGLIELRQRYPQRQVFLFTSREGLLPSLARDGEFDLTYRIADNLSVKMTFERDGLVEACARDALICHEPNFDHQRMQPLLDESGRRARRFPLLNSFELVCHECVDRDPPTRNGSPDSPAA